MTNAFASFDTWQLVALAAAIGWASGLRLYAVLFILGGWDSCTGSSCRRGFRCSRIPWCSPRPDSCASSSSSPTKIPGVDSAWDLLQTFIRIPAGAALAASVFGESSSAWMIAAAILGGTLAAGSHLAKSGSRAVINTSPEPSRTGPRPFAEELAVGNRLVARFRLPIARWAFSRCWSGFTI
jgi:hypothetical protein